MQLNSGLKNLVICCLLGLVGSTSFARQWEPGPPPPIAPYGQDPLPDEHVVKPMIFPILAPTRWTDDYGSQRDGFRHTAIDIRAAKMSPIVAPFDGVIGFKVQTFWIYGDDGWAVLGTHLNDDNIGTHDAAGPPDVMFAPDLVSGQRVYAGQFLGYVGMSGDATGPHLHFELYKPGEEKAALRIRDPFPSLKAAQVITSPRIRNSGIRPGHGEMRFDGCVRKVDQVHGFVTLILVSKQVENGPLMSVYGPRYLRLKLYDSVVASAGGWYALNIMGRSTVVSCFIAATGKSDDAVVLRLTVPPARSSTPAPVPSLGRGPYVAPAPVPPVEVKKPFIPANILIALAHDQSDREETKLPTLIKGMGMTPTVSLEATSKIDLAPYDVVIACHPANGNFPYDKEETSRLKDFVMKDGGGLFLIGSAAEYDARLSKMGPFALNKLAAQFNITFTQFGASNANQPWRGGATSTFPPHWVMPVGNFSFVYSGRDTLNIESGTPDFVVNRFGPVLVGFEVGAGRVLALAGSPDQFTEQLDRNPMFRSNVSDALQWLAEKRPAHAREGTVGRILPQTEISRGRFVFHSSGLFIEQEARGFVDAFQKIYDAEAGELGAELPDSLPKLDVVFVQAPGAYIKGSEMHKGTSEDLDHFMMVTGAALGSQWEAPGVFPGGFHEAWTNYCAYLSGFKVAKDTGNKRLEKLCSDIQGLDWLARVDPDLSRINPRMTDHDAVMKAFHMLAAMQKSFGGRFWARFLAAYRPYVAKNPGPLLMPDFIDLLSQAAGKDLRPWFTRCGTTY